MKKIFLPLVLLLSAPAWSSYRCYTSPQDPKVLYRGELKPLGSANFVPYAQRDISDLDLIVSSGEETALQYVEAWNKSTSINGLAYYYIFASVTLWDAENTASFEIQRVRTDITREVKLVSPTSASHKEVATVLFHYVPEESRTAETQLIFNRKPVKEILVHNCLGD